MTLYENHQLKEFISDFNLRKPNGVISFNAMIEFKINNDVVNKISEVQIITSTNTETIYFIENDIYSPSLPEMLEAERHEITYIKNEQIIIKGNNSTGDYSVAIKPVL